MEARSGPPPLLIARPIHVLLHGFGHAPPVGEAKLGQDRARGGEAERLNEILTQDPHGPGIEQERPLACEVNLSTLWVQIQELGVIEVFRPHARSFRLMHGSSF
jgi:hypothetical protein